MSERFQRVDVRNDHETHVALGEMALRDGHKWFFIFAALFFVAGLALLANASTATRLMGVGALAVALGIIYWRYRYWRYVRANSNRLAALGKQRLAMLAGGGGAGPGNVGLLEGVGLGAGLELGGAAGRGALGFISRL
jgi:hypothetical protein